MANKAKPSLSHNEYLVWSLMEAGYHRTEIATAMGIRESLVRYYYSRAVQKLAELCDNDQHVGPLVDPSPKNCS